MTTRTRLTDKTAAEAGNDLYTMNGARPTGDINPGEKYNIGGPAEFGETPISTADTKKLHDKDVNERNEQNIGDLRLASEEAIRNAAVLEQKAIRCLVASQRMLPGADRRIIEANAADLIRLPLSSIDAILSRQEAFARRVASEAEEIAEGEKPAEDAAQAPVAPVAPVVPADQTVAPVAPVAVEAAAPVVPADQTAVAPAAPVMAAAPAPAVPEEFMKQFQMMASKIAGLEDMLKAKKEEEEKTAAAEKVEDISFGETVKTASSIDDVFAATAPAASKKGVTSLSGMVRQASQTAPAESSLESLWGNSPDVSGLF